MADDEQLLLVTLEARLTKFERDMARAKSITNSTMTGIESRVKESTAKMETSYANTGRGIGDMFTRIGAAFAGAVSLKAASDMIDSSVKIQNQLKSTGLAGKDLKDVYDQLFKAAQRNSTPLEALVTLYSRVSAAGKDLNANQADVIKFSNGISAALKRGGVSAGESAGALLQLSQALGDGKIQAEEYNSLLDGGRPILQAVAAGIKDTGGSISKLTALVKDGKVSSEAFFRGFLAGNQSLEATATVAGETVSGAFVRLQNVLIDAAGKFNDNTEAASAFGKIVDSVAAQINAVDFASLIAQITAVTATIQTSIATVNGWAQALGSITGLAAGAQAAMNLIPGPTVKMGGIYSQDAVQSRIDDAFGTSTGGTAAQNRQTAIDAIVKDSSITGAMTAKTLQDRFAPKQAPLELTVTPKVTAPKQVSLADYPVPASAGKGSGGGKGGSGGKDGFAGELQSLKERTSAMQAATAAQAAINPLVNDYGYAMEKAETAAKLLAKAQEGGKTVTDSQRQQIDAVSEAYARASAGAKRLADSQADIKASAEAAMSTAKDVTHGLITDLASGKTGAEALANALQKVGDAILNGVLDQLFSTKGGSGLFGSLFSGLFGGGQAAFAATGVGLFDGGGWTGPGSKYQPKGVVHADEFVFSKAATNRLGVANLDALHQSGLRGYADGGLVGGAPSIRRPDLTPANQNNVQAITISAPITVTGSAGTPEQNTDLTSKMSKQLEITMRGVVADELRRQSRPGGFGNTRSR